MMVRMLLITVSVSIIGKVTIIIVIIVIVVVFEVMEGVRESSGRGGREEGASMR